MNSILTRSNISAKARCLVFLSFVAFALFPHLTTRAALLPLSGEARQSQAEVVITGTVAASRVLIVRKPGASTYLVRLQTKVEEVEKGGEVLDKPGTEGTPAMSEVRCWRIRKSDTDVPGGHGDIPADGSRFRMWLKKSPEGFWEPLQPNGIELLDNSPAMEFAEAERRATTRSFLFGIVGSVLMVAAIAVYMFRHSRLPR